MADIVLAGADEAELLAGAAVPASADWFLDRGARLVVIKDGTKGAGATDGTVTIVQPALPVRCVDAVGAGDAFTAGLLSAVLRSVPLDQALVEAAAVAACAVQVVGDMDGLPGPALRDTLIAGAHLGQVNR
jgi:2-dehydro-3-deoxygluconokinase